ncbi:hypothetical protein LTR37_003235 [Vermiconidia calcicola]|uniref:Uncharacterized protein n=1 Tax=Vermiconidia calcicola TaxID=1690605 RepID=A0ACC3NTD4_9PEZI|nr:hypothetical protein LTR37_003235 [Vermiconidia calcicola]
MASTMDNNNTHTPSHPTGCNYWGFTDIADANTSSFATEHRPGNTSEQLRQRDFTPSFFPPATFNAGNGPRNTTANLPPRTGAPGTATSRSGYPPYSANRPSSDDATQLPFPTFMAQPHGTPAANDEDPFEQFIDQDALHGSGTGDQSKVQHNPNQAAPPSYPTTPPGPDLATVPKRQLGPQIGRPNIPLGVGGNIGGTRPSAGRPSASSPLFQLGHQAALRPTNINQATLGARTQPSPSFIYNSFAHPQRPAPRPLSTIMGSNRGFSSTTSITNPLQDETSIMSDEDGGENLGDSEISRHDWQSSQRDASENSEIGAQRATVDEIERPEPAKASASRRHGSTRASDPPSDPKTPSAPVWAPSITSLDAAKEHLSGRVLTYRKLTVKDDDVDRVGQQDLLEHAQTIFANLRSQPAAAPNKVSEALHAEYAESQQTALGFCEKWMDTVEKCKTASARCMLLIGTGVELHQRGIPSNELKPRRATKTEGPSTKTKGKRAMGKNEVNEGQKEAKEFMTTISGFPVDTESRFSERFTKVAAHVKNNKLIALDVIKGQKLNDFLRPPDAFLARKITNFNGNKIKEDRQKAGKALEDQKKAEEETNSKDGNNQGDPDEDGSDSALEGIVVALKPSSTTAASTGKKRKKAVASVAADQESMQPTRKTPRRAAKRAAEAEE